MANLGIKLKNFFRFKFIMRVNKKENKRVAQSLRLSHSFIYFYPMKQIIILLLLTPVITKAQVNETMLNENIQSVMPKVVEWRRHFHQNPELSNREYKLPIA